MASKTKVKKQKVTRKPVLTRAKDSAREQIDQFLLGIQHSSLVQFSSKLKAADTSDLLMLVGRKVLEQAETIRATIPSSSQVLETVAEQAKKPFRAAARVANPLKSRATPAKAARPLKKATSKKKK